MATLNYAAEVAGWNDVSKEDQEYWADKLGDDASSGAIDPAMNLVQWLEIERTGTFLPNMTGPGYVLAGTPRYAISTVDLRIGLANARALAAKAGVTVDELEEADRVLHDRYGASLDGGTARQDATGFYGVGTTAIDPDRGVYKKGT